MIYFTFGATANHTDIYQITHGGLLIAKTSNLKPNQKHFLEVGLAWIWCSKLLNKLRYSFYLKIKLQSPLFPTAQSNSNKNLTKVLQV